MSAGFFYYRQDMKDAAVDVRCEVTDKGVGTAPAGSACDKGVQVEPSTEEASVWVMESLLGLTSETEREIDTLQDTVKLQQESIRVLEERLSRADQDLEELRAREHEHRSRVTLDRAVQVRTQTAHVGTDALPAAPPKMLHSVGVSCRPEVAEAGVGGEQAPAPSQQSVQTDEEVEVKKEEVAKVETVSTGSQWESPEEEDEEEGEEEPQQVQKRGQVTIAEAVMGSGAGRRVGEDVVAAPATPSPMGEFLTRRHKVKCVYME